MQVTKEMIEAAAKEIHRCNGMTYWDSEPEAARMAFRTQGRNALEAALSAMWQPIETAPRDGTEFQARIPGHGQDNVIAWDDDFECWAFTRDQEPPDCWTDGYCWESNEYLQQSVKPTHWMPLPPTPETK